MKRWFACFLAGSLAAACVVTTNASDVLPRQPDAALAAPFALTPDDYAVVADLNHLNLSSVEIAPGVLVDLALERVEIFAPDAQIVLGTPDGDIPLPRPEVAVFRGTADGMGMVSLSVSPFGVNGVVRHAGATYVITSGPLGQGLPTVAYNLSTLPEGVIDWIPFSCAADELAALTGRKALGPAGRHGDAHPAGQHPCRIASIAVETDNEFTANTFGGSPAAASAYVAALFGALTEIYKADFNATLQVGFLRLWTDTNDPWTNNECIGRLFQFQDYWNANMTGVSRHAAHFLTGVNVSGCGGVAYLPGLCQNGYDYGMSSYLNGSFPYPLQNFHPQNWDLMVTAHELGHNFGAPHTHTAGVDGCGNGDCSQAFGGTLMSYCHTCSGGMSNIALTLHPTIVNNYILPYLQNDAPCNLLGSGPNITDAPDSDSVCVGQPASFTVVASGSGPLSYQWYLDGSPIGGATSATYSIASATTNDIGAYHVAVTNACGTVNSPAANLAVNTPGVGDLNGDCVVDQADLALLLSCYNSGPCGDVDGDGDTDQADLAALLANYTP